MTLNPWSNIDVHYDAGKTNVIVGSVNSVLLAIAWTGVAISFVIVAILFMFKGKKNRGLGKQRLVNVVVIILCISGLTSIVGTIMAIISSL